MSNFFEGVFHNTKTHGIIILRKLVRIMGCLKGRKEKTFLPTPTTNDIKLTASGVTPDHIVIISQVHCPHNGLAAKTYGRGGGTRTPSQRFWRPLLYQLSYAPTLILL